MFSTLTNDVRVSNTAATTGNIGMKMYSTAAGTVTQAQAHLIVLPAVG